MLADGIGIHLVTVGLAEDAAHDTAAPTASPPAAAAAKGAMAATPSAKRQRKHDRATQASDNNKQAFDADAADAKAKRGRSRSGRSAVVTGAGCATTCTRPPSGSSSTMSGSMARPVTRRLAAAAAVTST
jgi:hypothetical protein